MKIMIVLDLIMQIWSNLSWLQSIFTINYVTVNEIDKQSNQANKKRNYIILCFWPNLISLSNYQNNNLADHEIFEKIDTFSSIMQVTHIYNCT